MPTATLNEIADLTGGRVVGDGNVLIHDALPLQDATAGCVTLMDHDKHRQRLIASSATAVVLQQPLDGCDKPMLIVDDLHKAFVAIIEYLRPAAACAWHGIHQSAHIASTAQIADDVTIHAGVSVGAGCVVGRGTVLHTNVQIMDGCTIGEDCTLYPGATLYPGTKLGNRVLIHASAVLGAFGFGYRAVAGQHRRTAQLGWVSVGDDVEIGAGTCIDRGTYGPTKIGDGSKLDNQVQIGHNCHIGRHNLICSQVGIAGSSSTGDYVVLAGQVGVTDHVHLHDRVTVGAQAGIICSISEGSTVVGSPAGPSKQKLAEFAYIAKLPTLRKELKQLQKQVAELETLARRSPTADESAASASKRNAA